MAKLIPKKTTPVNTGVTQFLIVKKIPKNGNLFHLILLILWFLTAELLFLIPF